jgi:hypothetical protein
MWKDPIVSEVRKAGEELAREADGNLHKFFVNLKLAQKRYSKRLTTKTHKNSAAFSKSAGGAEHSLRFTSTG